MEASDLVGLVQNQMRQAASDSAALDVAKVTQAGALFTVQTGNGQVLKGVGNSTRVRWQVGDWIRLERVGGYYQIVSEGSVQGD